MITTPVTASPKPRPVLFLKAEARLSCRFSTFAMMFLIVCAHILLVKLTSLCLTERFICSEPVRGFRVALQPLVEQIYFSIRSSIRLASISTVLEMTNDTADLGEADDKLLVAEPRHGCWSVGKF